MTRSSNTDEKQAVVDVIERENTAFWMKDEVGLLSCYAQDADTLRWGYWHGGGMFTRNGADQILPQAVAHMRSLKRPIVEFAQARATILTIHVSADMAWVSYERQHPHVPDIAGYGPNGTNHMMRVLERRDRRWLIVATVLLDPHLGDEVIVRVDAEARLVWQSRGAATRLDDDPNFLVRNGSLRLREKAQDARLRGAISWAASTGGPLMPKRGSVPLLIEAALGEARVSWVIADDAGYALVMLDDLRPIADRVQLAAQVLGLSPVQARLALAVSLGRSMTEFAAEAGVSPNTARTQLRRVFEKAGVSSQTALVRIMLSLTPPR